MRPLQLSAGLLRLERQVRPWNGAHRVRKRRCAVQHVCGRARVRQPGMLLRRRRLYRLLLGRGHLRDVDDDRLRFWGGCVRRLRGRPGVQQRQVRLRRDFVPERLLRRNDLRTQRQPAGQQVRKRRGRVRGVRDRAGLQRPGDVHVHTRFVFERLLQRGDVSAHGQPVHQRVRFGGKRLRNLRGRADLQRRCVQLRRRLLQRVLLRRRDLRSLRESVAQQLRHGRWRLRPVLVDERRHGQLH